MDRCKPDFLGWDFLDDDYFTKLPKKSFMRTIFDIFPVYFKRYDSYKDGFDRGFLERYMIAYGWEIDENIIPYIDCFLKIIDAKETPNIYLNHLSDILGSPPDIYQDDSYRNILRYIVSIYKIKGTKKSYELFFSFLGFQVEIEEIEPNYYNDRYDTNEVYDSGRIEQVYDNDPCNVCVEYNITFYREGYTNLSQNLIEKIKKVITFLEPINVRLRNLDFGIYLEDTLKLNITDEIDTETETNINKYWDTGEDYDDTINYDNHLEVMEYWGLKKLRLKVDRSNNQFKFFAQFNYNLTNPLYSFRIKFIKGDNILYQRVGDFISIGETGGNTIGHLISETVNIPNYVSNQYDYIQIEGTIKDNDLNIVTNFKQRVIIGNQEIENHFYKIE